MQGVSSAELHMPGAASLAKTASIVARASGVSHPLIALIPSMSWRPMHKAAAFGAVDVGEVAVGVEAVGELVGQLGQLIGAVLTGQPGQLRFGLGAGLHIDEVRQPMKEAADHRDMPGPEIAVALRLRGRGQHRRQGFTVERPPFTQIGGLVNPTTGLGAADPQPVGQRRGQLATQLARISLGGELIDQCVLDRRLPAAKTLEPLQHPSRSGVVSTSNVKIQGAFVVSLERVENLDDLLTTTRTHVRIITAESDRFCSMKPK